MTHTNKIKVNIINRYPPRGGVTGEAAYELQTFLKQKGLQVNIVHINTNYGGVETTTNGLEDVYSVQTFYNGKQKILRLLISLYEGFSLLRRSNSLKPDVTICMTDPPLLHLWSRFFLKNKHWALWSMDLYPEAFVADKIVTQKNFLYKFLYKFSSKEVPSFLIALGKLQKNYLQQKYGNKELPSVILPCGIFEQHYIDEKPSWFDSKKITLGYCGNLGQAHSVEFLEKIIDNFNPEKFQLILCMYGKYATQIVNYASGKKGIKILSRIDTHWLSYIDVHISSLKKDWINVCVPSKTVSSVCAGSTFLYYGHKDSDNWQLLKEAGWIINPSDFNKGVVDFLTNVTHEEVKSKKNNALGISKILIKMKENGMNDIYNQIVRTLVRK
jgi:glycosyltransferase involved in cell wall biosynthesis